MLLDIEDVQLAAQAGMLRNLRGIKAGYANVAGYEGDGWGNHIEGAIGEFVAAQELGLPWGVGINKWKIGDLGLIHVRTASPRQGKLIIRERDKPKDNPDAVFVLVVGSGREYSVKGWLRAGDARRAEWLSAPAGRPAAYFVPANELRSIIELRELIKSGEVQVHA